MQFLWPIGLLFLGATLGGGKNQAVHGARAAHILRPYTTLPTAAECLLWGRYRVAKQTVLCLSQNCRKFRL